MKQKIKKLFTNLLKIFEKVRKKLNLYTLSELNQKKDLLVTKEGSIKTIEMKIKQASLKKDENIIDLFRQLDLYSQDVEKLKVTIARANSRRRYSLFGKCLYSIIYERDNIVNKRSMLYLLQSGKNYKDYLEKLNAKGFNFYKQLESVIKRQDKLTSLLNRINSTSFYYIRLQTV